MGVVLRNYLMRTGHGRWEDRGGMSSGRGLGGGTVLRPVDCCLRADIAKGAVDAYLGCLSLLFESAA